jgi:transposase
MYSFTLRFGKYSNSAGIIKDRLQKSKAYPEESRPLTVDGETLSEDELRRFGYSKDHKFNQGQVLLSLMVTREGLPVGYEVYPGNMYEGDTFQDAIEKIKRRYRVKRAIVVADSGLLSKANIELLEKENYEFIPGARLKSLSDKWKNKIPDNTDYRKTQKEDETLRLTSYAYTQKRRLIISHSTRGAEKDRCEREKAIENLKKNLKRVKIRKPL